MGAALCRLQCCPSRRSFPVSALGPIEKKELRKILDGEGLTCAATHVGFPQMRDEMDKTIEMTLRYAHLSPAHKKSAVDGLEK